MELCEQIRKWDEHKTPAVYLWPFCVVNEEWIKMIAFDGHKNIHIHILAHISFTLHSFTWILPIRHLVECLSLVLSFSCSLALSLCMCFIHSLLLEHIHARRRLYLVYSCIRPKPPNMYVFMFILRSMWKLLANVAPIQSSREKTIKLKHTAWNMQRLNSEQQQSKMELPIQNWTNINNNKLTRILFKHT